ncbi:redoxin domain-containing protein [Sphingomonas lacunae]|uniref:Redoxin domain-containing protein n=1 Tax=Sphingomonas lacunae TaxID=2698828 RepID=A0A6M4AT42_9SPHN|nr:SCO family protein [Sphingomonas lacunae]QJQ31876.1 redoxin domain-containing protein [Sphingomonas lacunae]
MNSTPHIARSLALASLMLTGTMLTGCSGQPPVEPAPLEGAAIGGSFSLTDQTGRTVTDADFNGRYRLIYFGYSFCPDVCPVDLNWLMLGLKQFERSEPARAAKIAPIMITVDPERDTPEVMAAYVRQFHPRLTGLTGSLDQIQQVARKYAVSFQKQPGVTPGAYLVAHVQIAYLMGPDGKPVALIPVDQIGTTEVNEGSPDKVAAELARWVR